MIGNRLGWMMLVLCLVGCSRPIEPIEKPTRWTMAGPTMGTSFSITIADPGGRLSSEPDLQAIAIKVKAVLKEINQKMSTYDSESEISKFNASRSTERFSVSAELASVVARAKEIFEASDGAFDITVSPLVNLWGFGTQGERSDPPSDDQIQAVIASIGSQHLEVTLDPPTLRKLKPELEINLNAIAPGYAADRLGQLLSELGYKNSLVDVGGEFLAQGKNDDGGPWRVAIEKPRRSAAPKQSIERVLLISDQAAATSGDYRQFFEHNGKFYSHTIDPKEGKPVTHSLASVTIIAPDAMSADGWATAVMALGPDRGMKLVESLDRVEAILLIRKEDGTFEMKVSPGAEKFIDRSARKDVRQQEGH
jgi:FAD:protein FMN transferase